jgi:enoyl-CoA hydratase
MPEFITTARQDTGVELITLNRPPMNALSAELLTELADHVEVLAKDPELQVVVLTGSAKVFAAGADVGQLQDDGLRPGPLAAFRRACDGFGAIPRPVIAAVSGYALGGGLEVALACDLRIASESARLAFPEMDLGVFPGAGGTQRLARIVGAPKAKDLIWSARHVKAEEALALGLVDRIVPVEGYLEAALEFAAKLAKGPVVSMGLAKKAIDGGLDRSLAEGLDLEAEYFADVFQTEDARAGLSSFFENGPGKATFTGR